MEQGESGSVLTLISANPSEDNRQVYSKSHAPGRRHKVYVKTLIGRTHTVEVSFQDSIANIKEALSIQSNMPVGGMALIFAGKVLEDGRVLSDYHVSNESGLHLIYNPPNWA